MQRFLLLFFVTASLFAQSTLTVRVNEHYSKAPLPAVKVTLEQNGNTTFALTDSTGTAQLTFTATGIETAPVVGERPQKIELYNILGQRILSLHSVQDLNRRLGTLASGVYILRAFYRQQVVQAKSVVLNGHALNANWNGILNRSLDGGQTSLKKAVASAGSATDGDLHLTLSKEGCTSFDTTFAAPAQDTTLQVLLHQINRVKIRSFDAQGHELRLPFAVRGLSNSLEATGDSLALYSGRYRLQAQNPDTLQALIDTVEIVSDGTLSYVLPAVQKYRIRLTFCDTDGSPINGLQVELWKDNNLRYAFVTDSSGTVQDSVYSALYLLKAFGDEVKFLQEELNVNANLDKHFVTDEKDSVVIVLKYADGLAAPGETVEIGEAKGKTDTSGLFVAKLFDGSYTLRVSGDDIETLSRNITVSTKTTLNDTVSEIIRFVNPNVLFNEGDSAAVNPYDYVSAPNGIKSARFESLDSLLVVDSAVFKGLHITTSGAFNYRFWATAAHGTRKSASFTAEITNRRTFEGHIYELLAIYDGKDTVSFKGKIEVSYYGDPNTYYVFNTDENGHFHFTIPTDKYIAYFKYYTVDANDEINSFIVTYEDGYTFTKPLNDQEDWVNIGLMVTRFDELIHGYFSSADDDSTWGVSIDTYHEFLDQAITLSFDRIRAFNLEDAKNPIYENSDPTTDHGQAYVIPLDQTVGKVDNTVPWRKGQQDSLVILLNEKIKYQKDPNKRYQIITLLENDTLPVWQTSSGGYVPYPGVHLVVNQNSGNFNLSTYDYNYDNELDASIVYLNNLFWNNSQTNQEIQDFYDAVWPDLFTNPKDIYWKSVSVESQQSLDFSPVVDNKTLNALLDNFSRNFTTHFRWVMPDGRVIEFTKFNFYAGMPLDWVAGTR